MDLLSSNWVAVSKLDSNFEVHYLDNKLKLFYCDDFFCELDSKKMDLILFSNDWALFDMKVIK